MFLTVDYSLKNSLRATMGSKTRTRVGGASRQGADFKEVLKLSGTRLHLPDPESSHLPLIPFLMIILETSKSDP